ncbi:hypothetical protein BHE74_00025766, partial [Ensete ventricosum]
SSRKETVLDLAKFIDKGVQVKLTGGRQGYRYADHPLLGGIAEIRLTGALKGYDQLLNLVLDEAIEFLRDPDDPLKTTDQTRYLGLICSFWLSSILLFENIAISFLQICRGTAVMLVSPTDGTDEIANPFVQPDGA